MGLLDDSDPKVLVQFSAKWTTILLYKIGMDTEGHYIHIHQLYEPPGLVEGVSKSIHMVDCI